MAFVSRAKWFEYGEKSNKFFLNLTKSRQNQKLICKIKNGEEEFVGQNQVSKGITDFYRELYSAKPKEQKNEDNFYEYCPKLSEKQAKYLDNDLTLKELQEALSSCKDSSPGPDGIPFVVYKKYWNFMGPVILRAWKHSINTGNLPTSHLESVITLLPKEGKDTKDIKNWRPITLSNCDLKIITKAISLKTSKVLESIIDPSQTAYVPGRSVADHLRSNFFYKNHCNKNNFDAHLTPKKHLTLLITNTLKKHKLPMDLVQASFGFLRLSTETSLLGSSLTDLPANQSKLREELSRATP